MRERLLRADLLAAVALAVLALILAPGLAIVAMVAIAVLLACLISATRDARGRRRGTSNRAVRSHRNPRDVSARRPERR